MKKIYLDDSFTGLHNDKTAVSIGKFDGVHAGHKKLLDKLLEFKAGGLKTVAFCFEKSPGAFLSGKDEPSIYTGEELEEALGSLGVDIMAVYPVNAASMSVAPEAFVREILGGRLGARAVVTGPDCSFGAGGRGNAGLLCAMGPVVGFEYACVPKLTVNGRIVSSTLIKQLLLSGDAKEASVLLGSPYSFCGTVARGKELGRKLGFPTANILPPPGKLIPAHGVYSSRTHVLGSSFTSITNIGSNPTVSGDRVVIETNIPGFEADIYGREIKVEILGLIRREMKFSGVEELKRQIARDIQTLKGL